MTPLHSPQPRVLHIITGLEQGGAERQLTLLCSRQPDTSMIFSLREPGPMIRELEDTRVQVASGQARRMISVNWIARLYKSLRDWKPDVVVGWMYHGNVAATLTRIFGFRGPLFWNVRHSVRDLSDETAATRAIIRLGARLSRVPQRIIYNSHAAAAQHEALGFRPTRAVIPNGFDIERFQPNPERRSEMRGELALTETDWLIGVIGRAHPMKNHVGWLDALAAIRAEGWPVRSLMLGTGVAEAEFADQVHARGLDDAVILYESTAAPELLYPALDLLALPSRWGEAFPNVVGEAMACGVPALVTDIGDAAHLVGDTGFIAPTTRPEDLARTTIDALRKGTTGMEQRGRLARQRIREHFSQDRLTSHYSNLWN